MRFQYNLKALLSYLKEFPNPTFVERYRRLDTTCKKLKDSIDKLEQENASLKERLAREGTFVRLNGAYYFETPEGYDAPFCSHCWDTRARLVKLKIGSDGVPACPQCADR